MFYFDNPELKGIKTASFTAQLDLEGYNTTSNAYNAHIQSSIRTPFVYKNYFTNKPFSPEIQHQLVNHIEKHIKAFGLNEDELYRSPVAREFRYVTLEEFKNARPNNKISLDTLRDLGFAVDINTFFGDKQVLINAAAVAELERISNLNSTIKFNEFVKPFAEHNPSLLVVPTGTLKDDLCIQENCNVIMNNFFKMDMAKAIEGYGALDSQQQDLAKLLTARYLAHDMGSNVLPSANELINASSGQKVALLYNQNKLAEIKKLSDLNVERQVREENNGKLPEDHTELAKRKRFAFLKIQAVAENAYGSFKSEYNKQADLANEKPFPNHSYDVIDKISRGMWSILIGPSRSARLHQAMEEFSIKITAKFEQMFSKKDKKLENARADALKAISELTDKKAASLGLGTEQAKSLIKNEQPLALSPIVKDFEQLEHRQSQPNIDGKKSEPAASKIKDFDSTYGAYKYLEQVFNASTQQKANIMTTNKEQDQSSTKGPIDISGSVPQNAASYEFKPNSDLDFDNSKTKVDTLTAQKQDHLTVNNEPLAPAVKSAYSRYQDVEFSRTEVMDALNKFTKEKFSLLDIYKHLVKDAIKNEEPINLNELAKTKDHTLVQNEELKNAKDKGTANAKER